MATAVRIAPPKPLSRSHIPALDGVRGLAILGVFATHFCPTLRSGTLTARLVNEGAAFGAFGVDLFFVLSGFLITGILLDTAGRPDYYKNFYARRILRLFPIYYCYLLLLIFAVPLFERLSGIEMRRYSDGWMWYLTYFANWKPNFAVGDAYLGHFWSLAVEEQFYLIWPTVVLLSGRRLPAVCALLIAGAVSLRCVWAADGVYWNQIYRLTITRCDTMAMGALAAFALRSPRWRPRAIRLAPWCIAAGALGFLALALWAGTTAWESRLIQSAGAFAAAVAFAGIVTHVAAGAPALARWLDRPALIACGKYSYCMYVIHMIVGEQVARAVTRALGPGLSSQWIAFGIGVVAVFGVARLSWTFFEAPILRLKQRFE
jgi:peptidoglycan/LPS O-acetylase OafA/YrhL